MDLISKLFLAFSILISHYSGYSQTRSVEIEYKIVSPIEGELFRSPSKIPVAFRIYNHGTDTLFATDSFSYFISHEIQYPYLDTEDRLVLGKDIAPGDSSRIFRDTTFVNWTFDTTTFRFKLNVLCSYFTPGSNDGTRLKITNVADQNLKSVVSLKHDYLSSIPETENELTGLTLFPNPVTNKILTVRVSNKTHANQVQFDLINSQGSSVSVSSELHALNTYTLDLDKFPNGVFTLISRNGGFLYFSKVIIMN